MICDDAAATQNALPLRTAHRVSMLVGRLPPLGPVSVVGPRLAQNSSQPLSLARLLATFLAGAAGAGRGAGAAALGAGAL